MPFHRQAAITAASNRPDPCRCTSGFGVSAIMRTICGTFSTVDTRKRHGALMKVTSIPAIVVFEISVPTRFGVATTRRLAMSSRAFR